MQCFCSESETSDYGILLVYTEIPSQRAWVMVGHVVAE